MKIVLKRCIKVIVIIIVILMLFLTISFIRHKICLSNEKDLLTPLGELVEVDGHDMSIYIEGEGDHTLVFLSGSGTCSPILDFKSLYSLLSDDYRIVVVEKFGYGFSDIVDSDRDVYVMFSVGWDRERDLPNRYVKYAGAITLRALNNNNDWIDTKILRKGECIPGTNARLQADNYGIEFNELNKNLDGLVHTMQNRKPRQVVFVRAEEVIQEVAKLCNSFHAKEVILYGSRAKGTARERSDIDIAVSGIEDFEALIEKVEDLPTLYSVDLVNMDTCKNQLLLEDIRQYGRKI